MHPSEYIPSVNQQPDDNEIRVEYHPSAKKAPQHFAFSDFDPGIASGISASMSENRVLHDGDLDKEPWLPFSSRIDFEIADLILETHMNQKQTDGLLALIRQCIEHPDAFTLTNSVVLKETWDAARLKTSTVSQ
jgi:hypothetical protein